MTNTKKAKYSRLYEQLETLLSKSVSLSSQMATINAILYHKIQKVFWVGFYFHRNDRLIVGPYQGPLACQELVKPRGVCWASVLDKQAIIVPDVEKYPGHIACDSRSKSEIVLPVVNNNNEIIAVLDIDSDQLNLFDNTDLEGLQNVLSLLDTSLPAC